MRRKSIRTCTNQRHSSYNWHECTDLFEDPQSYGSEAYIQNIAKRKKINKNRPINNKNSRNNIKGL